MCDIGAAPYRQSLLPPTRRVTAVAAPALETELVAYAPAL